MPTARGWGCTGQGVSVLHEIWTFVEYTRMLASGTRPSCSTCGRHEGEIDLTEAIEGTASAYRAVGRGWGTSAGFSSDTQAVLGFYPLIDQSDYGHVGGGERMAIALAGSLGWGPDTCATGPASSLSTSNTSGCY